MIICRFLQGIGTGGEVPVASAYINEYIGARQRGRFFLLYEAMFLVGLVGAGLIGISSCRSMAGGRCSSSDLCLHRHDSAALVHVRIATLAGR